MKLSGKRRAKLRRSSSLFKKILRIAHWHDPCSTLGCGDVMKSVGMGKRFLAVAIFKLVLAGCSDVHFQPAPGAPIIFSSGTAVTDTFTQGYVVKKLDILFVVDNSGSMADEQKLLGARIDSFISTLYDVDWQIGVTTTDVSDGTYGLKGSLLPLSGASGYILTPKTPNLMQVFNDTVVRKETYDCGNDCPSGDEQPLHATIEAIQKRDTVNKGFFRPGAELGLLVLSDEDEMSTGPSNATQPADVLKAVQDAWADTKRLLTYGMVIKPNDSSCLNSQTNGGHYGTLVSALASMTNGLVGSICESDYAPTLGIIGDSARKLLQYVELRGSPDQSTIQITFTPAYSTTYRVEGRRIYFTSPPPKGTVIRVDYIVQ
jgi:hypothetical protein